MTKKVCSLGNILMGLILIVGPWFIFGTCSIEEKIMKCFWSCRAEFVLGFLSILVGILVLISKNKSILNELILSITISVLTILIPLVIIGGCMKSTMHCRSITFPVFYTVAIANILLQLFNLSKELKRGNSI